MPSQSSSLPRGPTPPHPAGGLSRQEYPSQPFSFSGGKPRTSACLQQSLPDLPASQVESFLPTSMPVAVTARPQRQPGKELILPTRASAAVTARPPQLADLEQLLPTSTPAAIMAQPQQEGTCSPHGIPLEHVDLEVMGDCTTGLQRTSSI